ncbi:MAG: VanZ family protein [Peptococcaceae bacterium]|jgi:glycopeptide antibiotics resistance protein|nr:VanZ family protein [Peptococcaceae bacterium]
MSTYFVSIKTAILAFIVLAGVLTVPYAAYTYRKYGAVSKLRALIVYSFVFYLECAYFMCILPLPDPAEVAQRTGDIYNIVPFAFVADFIKKSGFVVTNPSTWLRVLKSSYVYVPVFNILLTLPFGAYLAYYFKQDLKKVALLAFLLSLFFELTQLSGLYGVYPRPYRFFDVDDLLQNTAGGVLGYAVFWLFRRLLPTREQLDRSDAAASVKVSFTRRLVAFLIDSVPVSAISLLLMLSTRSERIVAHAVALLIYFAAVPLFFRGVTLGKRIVRIRIEPGNRPRLLLRYLLRNAAIIALQVSLYLTNILDDWQFVPLSVTGIIFMLTAIDLLYAHSQEKRLWYERLTQTRNISTFKETTP